MKRLIMGKSICITNTGPNSLGPESQSVSSNDRAHSKLKVLFNPQGYDG